MRSRKRATPPQRYRPVKHAFRLSTGVGRTGCRRTRRMRAIQIYNEADPIRSRRHRGRQDQDTSGGGRGKRKSEKKSICCRPHARPPPPAPGSQRFHVRPDEVATSQPRGQAVGTLNSPQDSGSPGGVASRASRPSARPRAPAAVPGITGIANAGAVALDLSHTRNSIRKQLSPHDSRAHREGRGSSPRAPSLRAGRLGVRSLLMSLATLPRHEPEEPRKEEGRRQAEAP